MDSEDVPAANANDIQGENNPMDSEESNDGDDISEFIDEIEQGNSTAAAAAYGNAKYNPKCPGLN
jgi:hypothetical protein